MPDADADLAHLYRRHVPAAIRLAFVLTGDEAEAQDIAHDAFIAAASRRGSMRDPSRFASYLRRTTVNAVRMRQRSWSSRRRREELVGSVPPAASSFDDVITRNDELVSALRRLPLRQREAICLRYLDDLSEREIARILGCPTGTVKSSISRGLNQLKRDFTE